MSKIEIDKLDLDIIAISRVEEVAKMIGRKIPYTYKFLKENNIKYNKISILERNRQRAAKKDSPEEEFVASYDFYKCSCGNKKCKMAKKCERCAREGQRKITWPTKDILSKEIWELPTTTLAKKYGVSDNAIAKWCKVYQISKPPRGYWAKIAATNELKMEPSGGNSPLHDNPLV